MIPTMSLENKPANTSAGGGVLTEQPLTALGLWWHWVLSTTAIAAMCWLGVVAVATALSPFGRYVAGVPLFIGLFFLGSVQGALVMADPSSEQALRSFLEGEQIEPAQNSEASQLLEEG